MVNGIRNGNSNGNGNGRVNGNGRIKKFGRKFTTAFMAIQARERIIKGSISTALRQFKLSKSPSQSIKNKGLIGLVKRNRARLAQVERTRLFKRCKFLRALVIKNRATMSNAEIGLLLNQCRGLRNDVGKIGN